ncbi:hypothetical protein [Adhaeribacter soli]|uniref:Uncharacterized protein n=1 Tax=Adhaeribacter soli TaxID=2607655 RepID=A0A5N1IPG9_9BACT|nr:hypothetical protein [Adhaeribacter soli]KAA9331777.1 hypothetical protein F0P94_13280 [Adhaeribacter soli]
MEKYLTVQHENKADALKVKAFRLACHQEKRPCVIITRHPDFAEVSCDNWLSTDDSLITVSGRMILEDQLQQLQKKYPETDIMFSTSEVRASNISNPIPLWYIFSPVPLNIAEALAEKIYDIYQDALPHGS